jgi:ATP-dependent exoDNAse (exonuclease V) beta subunit
LLIDRNNQLAKAIVMRSPLVMLKEDEWLELSNGSINLSTESSMRLDKFYSLLTLINEKIGVLGARWAVKILLEEGGYAQSLGSSERALEKWANVNKLSYLLSSPGLDPFSAIEANFQHVLDESKEAVADVSSSDSIRIMTIHQSKGLEFPVLVVADTEGYLPKVGPDFLFDPALGLSVKPRGYLAEIESEFSKHRLINRQKQKSEEQEQARLLYVAMTRAKEELYFACSAAGLEARKQSGSILNLLLRAYHKDPPSFTNLCSIVTVGTPVPAKPHEERLNEASVVYQPHIKLRRLFSSMLLPDQGPEQTTAWSPVIDGSLAHKIIAQVGLSLRYNHQIDEDMLWSLVNASARANAAKTHPSLLITQKASFTSLKVLKPYLQKAERAIFEVPLFSYPKPGLIIEGIADLVLELPGFTGIIEFKSSARLIAHPKTRLQILAYASALNSVTNKQIKYALLLIGSEQTIAWQDFNHLNKEELLRGLGRVA